MVCGWAAQGVPLLSEQRVGKRVGIGKVARCGVIFMAGYSFALDDEGDEVVALCHIGESIIAPLDGHDEGLAAEVLKMIVDGATGQEYSPPVTLLSLYEVGMAGAGDGVGTMVREVALSEDGIVFPRNEGTHGGVAAEDYFRVPASCATFCRHQEILAIDLVHVGTLNPDRIVLGTCSFVD